MGHFWSVLWDLHPSIWIPKYGPVYVVNRALVRILRSVGADFRFLNSLVSFINKDIEFLIKSVGAKAPFQKSVGAAAPTQTRALYM